MGKIPMRSGTHQGSKHRRIGVNNQDARLAETFGIPVFDKRFHVGLVSDGCTGYPAVSHTEVGSNLLVVFAYRRIQEFLCAGMALGEIPRMLFQSVTEFIRSLTNMMAPPDFHWPYHPALTKRAGMSPTERFRADYLSATLLGFVTDESDIVIFSAGDGIILMGDDVEIIDQDDHPDYPTSSINTPGRGFSVKQARLADVRRVALMSDALKKLVQDPVFLERLFGHMPANSQGLQFLLNTTFNERPEDMEDDATVVTFEYLEKERTET